MFKVASKRDRFGKMLEFSSTVDAGLGIPAPMLIPGLSLWLRADQLSGASGAAIANWKDESDAKRDAAQSVASAQPLRIESGQNGLTVARFDGSNDALKINSSITVGTVLIAAKYGATAWQVDFPGLFNAFDASDGAIYFTGQSRGYTTWYAPSQLALRLNGVSNANAAAPGAWNVYSGRDSTPNAFPAWVIGQDRTNASRFWLGDIGEIIVFSSALSDADMGKVEAYLKAKWATA